MNLYFYFHLHILESFPIFFKKGRNFFEIRTTGI